MTARLSLLALSALLGLGLGGCATAPTGAIAGTKIPAGAGVALTSTPFYPYDAFDVEGTFLEQLRGYGLVPTGSADAPYLIRIHFTEAPDAEIDCSLILSKEGRTILAADGSSRGGPKKDRELPTEGERRTAFRQTAFLAAAKNFAAKARPPG
jgi:hypothetical protein